MSVKNYTYSSHTNARVHNRGSNGFRQTHVFGQIAEKLVTILHEVANVHCRENTVKYKSVQ